LRRFAGVDLGMAVAPDETTILRFRHLLGEHELCGQILDTMNLYLASKGSRRSGESVGESSKLTSTVSTMRFVGGN
jgi:IS5 family transposase